MDYWTRGHTIGRGSSATVSTATSSRSTDTLAVKSAELSASQSLQREQKILSNLSNPHIVAYKGCNITRENNNMYYNLFMEYFPKGTVIDAIRRNGAKGLRESEIGKYTWHILMGLEYLHSIGIVHCDIKCSNILIGEEGGARIADFGCARWRDEAAPPGGTPAYMAPEVTRGEGQDFPADVWAVGCSIVEMATGGSPWPDLESPISALYTIGFSREIPKIPDFLSSQARDFLGKCLRRDPNQRWTAKQLLNHPFLEKFNSNQEKQIGEIGDCDSISPSSILDQGFWNSIEEEAENDLVHTSWCCESGSQRIGRLSLSSGGPDWRWDDQSWIMVRSNKINGGDELF